MARQRSIQGARTLLELVSKLLSAAIGCKACGSALSAKRVLDVLQHASEPFPPPALSTDFSLDFATKPVLKPVLGEDGMRLAGRRIRAHVNTGSPLIIRPKGLAYQGRSWYE